MEIIYWLDRKLTLPGDTEDQRAKKIAGWLAGLSGMLLSLVIGLFNLVAGLDLVAILYFELAVVMIFAVLFITYNPQHFYGTVFAIATLVTIHPWLVSLASGGFQSGLSHMPFILFGPVSALLLIGSRPALFEMGLLIIMAVITTTLDPWAAAQAVEVSPGMRHTIGLFNIVSASLMTFTITFFIYLEAERARFKSDSLLQNILPASIAARLKQDSGIIAERFPEVTILFADIVDFTPMSTLADPTEMVSLLNSIFSDFDDLADHYGLEKIKTIGDAYMVAGGLPQPRPDHIEAVAAFAIDALTVAARHRAYNGNSICVRIGINTGPVVAGVIGRRKFIYDLWGDAVNVASRMESQGIANCIQVTKIVRDRLQGRYEFVERSPITVKGKGEMITYLLKVPDQQLPPP